MLSFFPLHKPTTPMKPLRFSLSLALVALAGASCQPPITREEALHRPELRRTKGLQQIGARDGVRAMSLIRKEADLATLRPEDIRPLMFNAGGRLPAYMDPAPGQMRFAIAANGRRPVIYFVVNGIDWTPRMIYGVLLDWRIPAGPVTRALVWKEREG